MIASCALVMTRGCVMVEVDIYIWKSMYFDSDSMLDVPVDGLLQYYGIGRSKVCVASE